MINSLKETWDGYRVRSKSFDIKQQANYKNIHGWRYANNADKKRKNPTFFDQNLRLAACGDWCFGGRVEGAFTSAYNLAKQMKESAL